MKLPVAAPWAVAAGLTLCLAAPPAIAQAPADGSVREKDMPITLTEVAPGLFFR